MKICLFIEALKLKFYGFLESVAHYLKLNQDRTTRFDVKKYIFKLVCKKNCENFSHSFVPRTVLCKPF